jgi:hypothetical protein
MLVQSDKEPRRKWYNAPLASLLAIVVGACFGAGWVSTHREARPAAGALTAAAPALAATQPLRHPRFRPAAVAMARVAPKQPKHAGRPRVTVSLYERTTSPHVLRKQGCTAAKRDVGGIVILDFGQPAYNGHTYGTNLFSGRFAGNREITHAMLAYAGGYAYCLRRGSDARITLARGTSNYRPQVPSAYKAGRKWGRETRVLSELLAKRRLHTHVTSAAADDVEPAWDRTFHKTRDFFRGYRDADPGRLLYNFGSLDGGVGSIWSARQVFFVTGGMKYVRAIPEIYNHAMARQWAELAHIARTTYKRPVTFAGVMTQHRAGTGGMKPHDAHRTLMRALAKVGRQAVEVPATLTNIRAAQ